MKTVNFYFTACLTAADTLDVHLSSLQAWRSGTEDYLKALSAQFGIGLQTELKRPDLADPPSIVFGVAEPFLELQFWFDYYDLEHAKRMIDMLQATLAALCWKRGLDFGFEYHLE